MPKHPDVWVVDIESPDDVGTRILISDIAVKTFYGRQASDFATAAYMASLMSSIYKFGGIDADTAGETDEPDGQHSGEDQAGG